MALSFDEVIRRANVASPSAMAHVFIEYADGKRGYFRSYPSVAQAIKYCDSREGQGYAAMAYGKNGEDLD